MLGTITLRAGIFQTIGGVGKHFSVLACGSAGVRVKFYLSGGVVLETDIRASMSLETGGFDSVMFSSDIDQTVEYWHGESPLVFNSSSNVVVGSAGISSMAKRAFSGENVKLLESTALRGKSFITPDADILIGDEFFGNESGVKIKAGERFEISTQGEIYCRAVVGGYGKVVSSTIEAGASVSPVDYGSSWTLFEVLPLGDGRLLLETSSGNELKLAQRNADGSISFTGSSGIPNIYKMINSTLGQGSHYQFVAQVGAELHIIKVDKKNGDWSSSVLDPVYKGCTLVAYNHTNDAYIYSPSGGARLFKKVGSAGIVELTFTVDQNTWTDGVITNDGGIHVWAWNRDAHSIDGGTTWTAEGLERPQGVGYDEVTGVFYANTQFGEALKKSNDGLTWVDAGGKTGSVYSQVFAHDGRVFSVGGSWYSQSNDGGVTWVEIDLGLTWARGCLSYDGVWVVDGTQKIKHVSGTQVVSGGVNVAIMSEFN